MLEMRKPIPVSDAIAKVINHTCQNTTEYIPLSESYGYTLAEPIIAQQDVPHFNRSAYDGFAIRSADSVGATGMNRIPFRVIDHIGAGHVAKVALAEGEAVRIMTGAAMPTHADAVVMLEQAVVTEQGFTIRKPFEPHENVSLQGEDACQGEELIPAGGFIHPGTIALLATFGYTQVRVTKKPIVGILATGTELLDTFDDLVPGKIRNSNGPMIAAQLARLGVESRSYGMLADDMDACYETVVRALRETDCLITTGGVSVGDYDYLPTIYERLGAEVLFNKVSMRPGSVTTAAVANGQLLFGLSGNPSACFTGFELFVRPALNKMMGSQKLYLPYEKAVLTEDFSKANPFTRFIRAVYRSTPQGATVTPAGFNKSNAVSSIARGNALIVLPGGSAGYEAGDEVDVLVLGVEEGTAEWLL
ncbi:molybdopterin molybdenumtransferase [Paenibacillus selenitireducens]|uniref:Molybdopterin molybdenumtransferase n=1 Tax=Paenibacillus selenitireducens TaxID=1324314 RepID=A0A1T2X8K3_9BACL|nr:gephyrin-like molybdotransferase Glp [Paenibacillus selenitireducens]OPA76155.1 molybdopterin molybdenumtransferase [Paenibacillus selenitireducens]